MTSAWNEEKEKCLLESVNWVDENFPGASGKEIMSQLGGKWVVVATHMKRSYDHDFSAPACKTRFYDIKNRQLHTKTKDGKDVIVFESTEFPQVSDEVKEMEVEAMRAHLRSLESRVRDLEEERKKTDHIIKIVDELNNSFQEFFKTYK